MSSFNFLFKLGESLKFTPIYTLLHSLNVKTIQWVILSNLKEMLNITNCKSSINTLIRYKANKHIVAFIKYIRYQD